MLVADVRAELAHEAFVVVGDDELTTPAADGSHEREILRGGRPRGREALAHELVTPLLDFGGFS